jgi:hypothetical protein
MREITTYRTADGECFFNRDKAHKHEEAAFQKWLSRVRDGESCIPLSEFLLYCDEFEACDVNDWYGSGQDHVVAILRNFWCNMQGDTNN